MRRKEKNNKMKGKSYPHVGLEAKRVNYRDKALNLI
jgi:hypothetical protein